MSEYKYIKELLSTGTGTEGTLLIPRKIFDTLIPEVEKRLIPRSEAMRYVGPEGVPGSSLDVDRVIENTLKVRLVPEGSKIPSDAQGYNTFNIKPLKYGVSVRITREMVEDSKFPLMSENITIAGRRFAENENTLVIAALDGADNTVSGGAAITIPNITRAVQYLEDADYNGTTFAIGNEVLNDLRNIDTFVEWDKVGNTEMLTKGFLGRVYGLDVIRVSTNAGMTATSSYVFDRDFAYMIVEKRPISVESFETPLNDMSGVAITQRLAVSAVRTAAIAKITTT